MRVEDCIFFQLSKASQVGTEFWGAQVAPLGLTASQALVLNFLREQDGITSQQLGERIGVSSATMTGILDRLERLKVLERDAHPEDRRAVQVRLTKLGAKVAADIGHLFVESNRRFLAKLSANEVDALKKLLGRLRTQR